MSKSVTESFRTADISAYEDVRDLSSDLDKVLWVLLVARDLEIGAGLSANSVEHVLLDCFAIRVPRKKIIELVRKNSTYAFFKRRGRGGEIRILDAGLKRISGAGNSPMLINPTNAFSGRRKVQAFFAALTGSVRICDPYVDPSTLDYVARIAAGTPIQVLTVQINNEAAFRRDLAAFRSQHGPIDVRRTTVRTLHDRYVIDDKMLFSLGTSLNGLGKKQSIIVELGSDFRNILISAFDAEWVRANPI